MLILEIGQCVMFGLFILGFLAFGFRTPRV